LEGIVVAIIVSMLALMSQVTNPPVYVIGKKRDADVLRPVSPEHPDDETWPGLLIVRTEGRAFFANAPGIGEKIMALVEQAKASVVVLDCSAVPDIEYTALKMLIEGEEKLRARGIALWLAALNPEVLTMVNQSSLGERLGRQGMLFNLQVAVEQYTRYAKAGVPAQ